MTSSKQHNDHKLRTKKKTGGQRLSEEGAASYRLSHLVVVYLLLLGV